MEPCVRCGKLAHTSDDGVCDACYRDECTLKHLSCDFGDGWTLTVSTLCLPRVMASMKDVATPLRRLVLAHHGQTVIEETHAGSMLAAWRAAPSMVAAVHCTECGHASCEAVRMWRARHFATSRIDDLADELYDLVPRWIRGWSRRECAEAAWRRYDGWTIHDWREFAIGNRRWSNSDDDAVELARYEGIIDE
jgi:hypothetical protein